MTLVENQKVLLKKDNCYKIVNIVDKTIELDRVKFSLIGLIGNSFGSTFTVDNGNLTKIVDKSKFDHYERLKVEKTDAVDVNTTRDNRNMNLHTKNQLMTATDIDELKRNGESGDVILNKLIENSTSFSQKTTFAQEKYLTKKKKRYLPEISVHRITTRMLCELYAARNKLKIMNLRIDSVAQILAYSNAHCGTRVLLAESCSGLILGSLIERGALVTNFYHGSAPVLPDCYDEWRELDGKVFNLPLGQLVPLATAGRFVDHFVASAATGNDINDDLSAVAIGNDIDQSATSVRQKRAAPNTVGREQRQKRAKLSPEVVQAKREERDRRRDEASAFLLSGPHDALVVAIKLQPVALVLQLLELLGAGKPFVVYGQFLQPLVELYDALRKRTNTCSLRISESWLRNYQVLPDRTHPEMSMSGTGGYLLTGIKLVEC